MSAQAARAALERMNLREVAIAAHYTGLVADLRQMATSDGDEAQKAFLARRADLCMAYGLNAVEQRKPFAFAQGIAIIPVHGSLINRFGQSWGYVTGYNFLRKQAALAGLDPEVMGIIYDHNTYGGEAAGCFETTMDLRRLANGKRTLAVVDSNCYSAGYALATAADKIVVTPSGGAGSIGVVAMHVNMSKMLEDWGIEVSFIFAGEHKVDGNPFETLPDSVRKDIQIGVDKSREAFVALVAGNRRLDPKVVRDTEARIYRADDALAIGLIDAVATPEAAMRAFLGELSGSPSQPQKEDEMSAQADTKPGTENQPDPAAADKAAADARTAERTRIAGIQNCEEAKGRTKLASHLALSTSMSVEDAKAVLAASAVEEQAKPAANPFKTTMDGDKHPNIGADKSGNGEGDGDAPHLSILRAQEHATGRKLLTQQ